LAGPFELPVFGYMSEHYMQQNVPAPLIWYFEFLKFPGVLLGFGSDIFNLPKLQQFFQKNKAQAEKRTACVVQNDP
jgi:hypothetical protein